MKSKSLNYLKGSVNYYIAEGVLNKINVKHCWKTALNKERQKLGRMK